MAIILSSSAMAAKINKINVRGNKRIEQSTIVDYLNVRVGDHYSEAKKNEMIKNLYATSLFETINIAFHKGALKVSVQETPFISRVVFAGNYKVRTKILLNEIYTAPGESLRKAKIRTDVEKIKEIYKRSGRFSVHVSSKIEPLENNRVKVIFEIDEGPKTGIKNIYFAGNSHYKDSELKSIVLTKESRWFRFLETNDTYDPDRIEFDKQLLKRFYNSVGFADFRVISVTSDLLPTKEGFALTYSIEEGEKYKFGKITINNKLDTIDDSEVLKFVDAKKEGETFNLSAMQRMAEKVSKYLGGKGYPQVEVHPEVTPNRASGTVDVVIVVDQASKIFINKINIEGNLKTEDSVIRRQLQIAEGDVFNRSKLERGQRNIRNLDYFGKFNLGMSQTKKQDRYDINIDVEEKSTASFGFDLGYNTTGGMFGKISFLERNLIGSGRQFNAGVQIGKKSTHYYTGLTDPSFLGKDLSLGGTLFKSDDGTGSGFENGKQNYSSSTIGTRINLGYNITDDLFHGIEYGIKKSELKAPGKTASIFIKEQMGKFVTSEISHSLTYDKTDSRILPKNGYLLTAEQAFAGIGGDTNYLKHELSGKAFKSFVDNKYTLKFSAAGGHIKGLKGKKVRIPDRFTVGDYNLRGFASGGIGPRDVATKESINGQKYYTLSTELSFPLGLPEEFNMTGSIFIDAGALWDADSTAATSKGLYNTKTLRSSYGFGVLWITRIAPIRLDWGFPIKKEKFDETQVFHIRFSTHL
ncbi:MAG: outer membrane protein assembly factor BamA [Rickettsiales bacterium]|nr:MAG: outer membrane protein assembly factor BamA [Rickettsiales bacterium]